MSVSITQRLLGVGRGTGLKAQLVRGAMGVAGLKMLSMPLTLSISILLARGLGPEGYGQYVFVIVVISLLALPIGPGLGQLVTREVASYHHGEEWGLFRGLLRRAHQWALGGSALIIGLVFLLAASRAQWQIDDRWTLLALATPLLPLLALNALRGSTLRGLRHVLFAQLPELLARPGLHVAILASLLLVGSLNAATAMLSQIFATAGAFLLGAWFLLRRQPAEARTHPPEYRNHQWGQALLPFTLLAAVATLNSRIGILALGWLGTDAHVAALQVATSGAMLVSISLTIVNLVIAPHITRARRDGNDAKLQQLSRQSARAALLVGLPVALPLIFLGGPIIGFIYGEPYAEMATWPLAILALAQLVNVAFGSVGMFLVMSGFEQDTLYGQLIALSVNAASAVLLIPMFGAVGAAIAVAIGLVTWNIVLALRFVRRLGFRPSAL